jgi:hypothetical protein
MQDRLDQWSLKGNAQQHQLLSVLHKAGFWLLQSHPTRTPRIISTLQRLCEHGKAANEAAEQQDNVSTLDEIA